MFTSIIFTIMLASLVILLTFYFIDSTKKRISNYRPFISVMIPTFNDGETLEKTIKSLYSAYDRKNFELFVINDASKDNTSEILKELSKRFPMKIITNKKNIGKSNSLNKNFGKTKGKIILILDSDGIIRRENFKDIFARLSDQKVGAVSCRYRTDDKGFLARMIEMDCAMLGLLQVSHKLKSTYSLWGGCLAVKREAFQKAGLFSANMLTEDMDLALKLQERGWRVEQSDVPFYCGVPKTWKSWYKQKIRWAGGFAQCFLKHFKIFLKNPFAIFFFISNAILAVLFFIGLAHNIVVFKNALILFDYFLDSGNSILTSLKMLNLFSTVSIVSVLGTYLFYPLFSIPYVATNLKEKKSAWELFLIFPFSIIYFPLLSVASIHGFIIGFYKYAKHRKNEENQAW